MDTCPTKTHLTDPAAAPEAPKSAAGRTFWRSLDELADTPEFQEALHREFPRGASEWHDPVSRRNFLKLMGASVALAGVGTACTRQPDEAIVPYVMPPEQIIPGKPLFFATTFPQQGYGLGVLAESHMGRPTKLEGNPDHPASLGATDAHAQASILTMYDPDRAQVITNVGNISTWTTFVATMGQALERLAARNGRGLRILTETVTSPTLAAQMAALLQRFPEARWHHYEPFAADNVRLGAEQAFGRDVNVVYRLDNARRILSLDADFLHSGPGSVRYGRDFAQQRKVRVDPTRPDAPLDLEMNRLYAIESTPTLTGAAADHRRAVRASQVGPIALLILEQLRAQLAGPVEMPADEEAHFIWALVQDLVEHRGNSVVIAGEHQTPDVHAAAHAMNELLGAVGQTVVYTEPVEATTGSGLASLAGLVQDMQAGEVDLLLIMGGNPVFTAPADLEFLAALDQVPMRVHHSLYYDETSFHCHWHVPDTHYLEQWGDLRAFDGTASIVQPLIAPLYRSKSAYELLAMMLGDPAPSAREIVQNHWRERLGNVENFDRLWYEILQHGVIPDTAAAPVQVSVQQQAITPAAVPVPPGEQAGLEIIFRPDPYIGDGRWANNGWLQELPKPLTKLVWDNVAHMSPATAVELGLASRDDLYDANGKLLRLSFADRELVIPLWVMPGHPDGSVTIHCGFGRERISNQPDVGVAVGVGRNAYRLRVSQAMSFGQGLLVEDTGDEYRLATTQPHHVLDTETVEPRDIIRATTLAEFRAHPREAGRAEGGHRLVPLSLYPEWEYGIDGEPRYPGQHAWGMSIDMTACTGCQACVIACQAENNIPVVGKDEVIAGREMHWLRIDTYYTGEPDMPGGPYFQPMLCQHCEKAPCEVVCPVAATTHSAEGINEMTYNRCVGTRYCSNNCPYKVRRFNFFSYAEKDIPVLSLMYNPDVTVRDRGVMEKCTFCVQRLNQTRIEIKKLRAQASEWDDAASPEAGARLRERIDLLLNSLQTACQQACPTEAIVFGDLNHEQITGTRSLVKALKLQPHSYGVLHEVLQTQPRVTYLAKVSNPNEVLAPLPEDPSTEHVPAGATEH